MNYLCLKTVLSHMDAGTRIVLQKQCPRIQRIDKEQSAKIGTLQLPPGFLRIDSLTLRLGIVRYYSGGKTPDWVQEENANGGVAFDVGDFRGLAQSQIIPRRELDRAPTEDEKEEKEAAEQRLREMDEGSDQIDEEEKEKFQKIIETFNYRVWISELEYEEFVRLTVTSRDGLLTIEHVKYVMSLEDTWKYLIKKLIKPTVLVENYLMTSGTEPEIWPFGPTLRVANLRAEKKFWSSRDMHLLRNALSSESNFPLKSLETLPRRSVGDFHDHLAQKFIINDAPNQNLIQKLKCPNIHFKDYSFKSIPFEMIFGILKKETSKQYVFETSNSRCVEDLIEYAKTDRRLPEERIVQGYERNQYPIQFAFNLHGVMDLVGEVKRREVYEVFYYSIHIRCQ